MTDEGATERSIRWEEGREVTRRKILKGAVAVVLATGVGVLIGKGLTEGTAQEALPPFYPAAELKEKLEGKKNLELGEIKIGQFKARGLDPSRIYKGFDRVPSFHEVPYFVYNQLTTRQLGPLPEGLSLRGLLITAQEKPGYKSRYPGLAENYWYKIPGDEIIQQCPELKEKINPNRAYFLSAIFAEEVKPPL